ncbi:DedA family protein [Neisseriaceae bacterium ESL0693]|nr:DedA family protein [Neisseriaceae bacterium ESL0693]
MEFLSAIIDFIVHIDQHLQYFVVNYGLWIYAILFILIFCETGLVITPFLPGDSLLFAAGSIAAIGEMNIHVMVLLLILAAILGDIVNFTGGKFFGRQLFSNPQSRIFKPDYLYKTQAFYARHGGKTIIIARFIPIIRTFAPFVGGMGQMDYSQFLRYNIFGGCVWVLLFSYAGYWFGNLNIVKDNLSLTMMVIILISLLPALIELVRHQFKRPGI